MLSLGSCHAQRAGSAGAPFQGDTQGWPAEHHGHGGRHKSKNRTTKGSQIEIKWIVASNLYNGDRERTNTVHKPGQMPLSGA